MIRKTSISGEVSLHPCPWEVSLHPPSKTPVPALDTHTKEVPFLGWGFKGPHWYLVSQAGACWILGGSSGGSRGIEGHEGQQVLWTLA